jgi:FdhE protein
MDPSLRWDDDCEAVGLNLPSSQRKLGSTAFEHCLMIQKILQPGEIGQNEPFPHVVLPTDAQQFAQRARRFEHLARDHALGPLLRAMAHVAQAQQQAYAANAATPVAEALLEQSREHGMPPLSYQHERDPSWLKDLDAIAEALASCGEAVLQEAAQKLKALDTAGREAIADAVFGGGIAGDDAETHALLSPLVGAALQVWWTRQAASLKPEDVGLVGASTVCPCCGSRPTASVVEAGGQQANLRYLHCSLCATQWHMVRVTCTVCESAKDIAYYSLNGKDAEGPSTKIAFARAEACDHCHSYLKIFTREKEPMMDVLADDLATLTLDMLVDEAGYLRSGPNLLFSPGVPDPE